MPVPLKSSVCVLIALVPDPEQTRHLPAQPGLLLGKRKGMEKMTEGKASESDMVKTKWKHLTLRLKTDPGAAYGSMPCVTYHTPPLPSADNSLKKISP